MDKDGTDIDKIGVYLGVLGLILVQIYLQLRKCWNFNGGEGISLWMLLILMLIILVMIGMVGRLKLQWFRCGGDRVDSVCGFASEIVRQF